LTIKHLYTHKSQTNTGIVLANINFNDWLNLWYLNT
jgi:hypothetical protein